MFYEPARSPYDWKFQLGPIPVRVHPWFWLLSVFLGLGGNGGAREILAWVAVVFVSILVHELGHALAMQIYGIHSRIVLYSFGGLTISDFRPRLRWFDNVFISFAGPLAGFLFLGLVLILFSLTGNPQVWELVPGVFGLGQIVLVVNPAITRLLLDLIFVNMLWGIFNLLPIFPLDGGQITREFFQWLSPYRGFHWALSVSMVTAIVFAVFFLSTRQYFAAIMFGMLAMSNRQMMRMYP